MWKWNLLKWSEWWICSKIWLSPSSHHLRVTKNVESPKLENPQTSHFFHRTPPSNCFCVLGKFSLSPIEFKKKKKSHSRYEVSCLLISCLLKITFYRSWQKFWPNSCFRVLYQQWSFTLRAFYEEGLQRLIRVTLPQH